MLAEKNTELIVLAREPFDAEESREARESVWVYAADGRIIKTRVKDATNARDVEMSREATAGGRNPDLEKHWR